MAIKDRLIQGVALLTAAIGMTTMLADTFTKASRDAATAIEDGGKFSPTTASAITEGAIPTPRSPLCRLENSRSTLTLDFAAIDALVKSDDGARLTKALAKAHADILDELACEPKDGNAWMRLAMIENAQGAPIQTSLDELKKSQDYAPAEGWILRARLTFTTAMVQAGLVEFNEAMTRDLKTLVGGGSILFITDLIAAMPRKPKETALQLLQQTSPEKSMAVGAELLKRRKGS